LQPVLTGFGLASSTLQGFMRMIVRHPQLKDAEAVKIFLLQVGVCCC
jgi:hypothetical protein